MCEVRTGPHGGTGEGSETQSGVWGVRVWGLRTASWKSYLTHSKVISWAPVTCGSDARLGAREVRVFEGPLSSWSV